MDKKRLVFFLIYSFAIMLFCTFSSPLMGYLHVDSAVFFTIGRCMKKGMVVYRDLFDHKGWYIYFFNFLGACISDRTTLGLYIVESLFLFADMILCFLIGSLYLDKHRSVLFSLIMSGGLLNYFTHEAGNVTEYYAVTFVFISLYLVVLYDRKTSGDYPAIHMLIHGICAGVCFFIRPNLVMMFGAVPLVMLIIQFAMKKYVNVFRTLLAGIGGLMLSFTPPLLYAWITGCFRDMFFQMIVFNLKYTGRMSLLQKLKGSMTNPAALISLLLLIISLVIVVRNCRTYLRVMFILASVFSLASICLSGRGYGHYFEYLIPLFSPAVLYFCSKLPAAYPASSKHKRLLAAGIVLVIACLTVIINMRTPIRYVLKRRYHQRMNASRVIKEEYTMRFGDDQDVKILALRNNASFYNTLGVYPAIKYFYLPAIPYADYPEAADSQYEAIMSGEFDVIISFFESGDHSIYGREDYDTAVCETLSSDYEVAASYGDYQMWIKRP